MNKKNDYVNYFNEYQSYCGSVNEIKILDIYYVSNKFEWPSAGPDNIPEIYVKSA